MSQEELTSVSSDQEKKSQYKDLLKYTGLLGGAHGLTLFSSLIRNKLTVLLLGPSGIGIISLLNSVITILNNISNLGISFSAVRNLSAIGEDRLHRRTLRYVAIVRCWSLITALFGLILGIGLAGCLSQWTFGDASYKNTFRIVSFVVAFTALTGGELAILKGMRQLKQVALSSLIGTILSIFVVIPLYYLYGNDAIVFSLFLIALITFLVTINYSFRVFPWHWSLFSISNIRAGSSLVKLGVAFIIAGTFGAIADYLIRTFILDRGTIDTVGYYNAAMVLCVTYMGMVYVAIDNDYFSKLSAVNKDQEKSNMLINSQIELSILLVAPMIVGLLVFLPIIFPLLYSADFLIGAPMIRWAFLFLFLKGFNLSLNYIALSKGDSRVYLILELSFHVWNVLFSFLGFIYLGITGLGAAMSLAALLELLLLSVNAYRRYQFRFTKSVLQVAFSLLPLVVLSFIITNLSSGFLYWFTGVLVFIITGMLSVYLLNKRTGLVESVMRRVKK